MMQGATTLAATRSPLDKLVRQQSKRAGQRPPAPPAVVISPDVEPYHYGNDFGPGTSHDSPASYASQPLSPLLHTRFGRDTARYSDLSDRSSPGSLDDRDELDSAHRPFSHLASLSLESAGTPHPARAPDSPLMPSSPALDAPARTPPRRSDVDPFAFRNYESQQQQQLLPPVDPAPVPTVVLNDEPAPRESRHRVPVQIAQDTRPRYNFSRPLRRQEPPASEQVPPPPSVPAPSPPSPTSSSFSSLSSHNPYMRQYPAPSQSQRPPSPDRDSYLAYDEPDSVEAQHVEVAEEALFRSPSSTRRHPYAYASGGASSSNYEYDDAASPVEISPITPRGPPAPTQHAFSSPDKNVTTPWARMERRKTLPPQGGFELRLDEHDEHDEGEGPEDAMAFHAAAFSSAGSDLDAPVYDDGTMRSHATARSSAFSTALPSLGRSSYEEDEDERRALSPHFDEPTPIQHSFPASQLPQRHGYPSQPSYPDRGSPQHRSREPSPQLQQPRGSSPQPPRGMSPHTVQHIPPPPPPEPIDTRQSASTRADRGVSYYSTTSSYFPPPSAHPTNFVPLPGAPPPANRPGSSTSLYSNYSYYNIPPSPTGSGGSRGTTPTDERFGATLAPTASGRNDHGRMSPSGGGRASPNGGRSSPAAGPSYPSYGAGPSNYGSPSRSGQQSRPGPSEAGLLAARDIVGRTSEDTVREGSGSRGWFGRRHHEQREREPRPSHESGASSTGRRSPGSMHKQHFPTLPNPSPDTLRAGTAQEFLTLGIAAHEALRLPDSAYCFEQAATLDGGCAVGMLMWGLALRHGWGVRRNEKDGFKWLRRAAGRAVEGLEAAARGEKSELEGVKTELVLAIYEVGQCFFHGWGVTTDRKMAVSYYQVAARLGDMDAQQALAFCYANGRGTKKDLKESAKWYRAAAAQGASTVGLAWIYKTKYGAEEDADGRPARK